MTTSLSTRRAKRSDPVRTYVPTRLQRHRLSPGARKAVVLIHIIASIGWLGVTATFVVLTVALLDTTDAPTLRSGYAVHEMMVTWLARPAALLTLGTGLLLSFTTGWSLHRHWWVVAKLLLLVATVGVTVSISPATLEYAIGQAELVGTPGYLEAQRTLVLMALYHVVMISAAAALSVYKPGVRRRRSVGESATVRPAGGGIR